MYQVFLGIGGNIGNKRMNFEKVHFLVEKELGKILRASSVYETAPWGFSADENFWNQVLLIETELRSEELLARINRIEKEFGRKREPGKWTSREMDIDILYYEDLVVETKKLAIPHPYLSKRMFVLVPLAEIAPEFRHPVLKKTNRQLLEDCTDKSEIKKVEL
ncbi:MAG TPA: 2-amino-4-hydroxy-6-hydroxymethyldihydropteridine diphosphokinase [Mariniphaga anaerophila]|uniref:2-amino-4-hydroxy-6-hydroxymethyldihydropteridine pyrophosphokinase n=1 Tax=Mariniphaga anaerophila TaxID=1484053 RepID=A0A831LBS4_9BACT|nr:2-amino-4-hydroxy-6-hydroxymethyldihydropteridine diphosphokinase [Mariniphaga anaerophila]